MIPLYVDLEFPLLCLGIFSLNYAIDWEWAKYTRALVDRARVAASVHAALIIGLVAMNTMAYINDWLLVIPAMLGAAAGTWHSVGKKHADSSDNS